MHKEFKYNGEFAMTGRKESIMEAKSNQSFLKQINMQKVLNLLRKHGFLSRIELAELSRLDKKTITNIVNELLERKLVRESGYKASNGGRRRQMLELNDSHSYHIGLDLGVTHITGVILDFKGNTTTEIDMEMHYNLEPDVIMLMVKSLLSDMLRQSGVDTSKVLGIGFSIPGFINRNTGVSEISENIPGWNNIPVRDILHEELDTAFYIEDCSRTMALAEQWFGEGRNIENFIVFDLGFGIGCGIVIDGNLYMGSNFKSGEIGHTIVEPGGTGCVYGHSGCIEALASGKAIAGNAVARLNKGEKSLLPDFTKGDTGKITAREVILAADLGDRLSADIIRDAGRYIGIGIANALHFFNPGVIIMGGRLVMSGNILFHSIIETIRNNSMPDIYNDVRITKSKLGHRASALGAAVLSLQKLFNIY